MPHEKRDPVIEAIAGEALATIEQRREAAEQAKVYQLAFWPEHERALPGDFIACAVFSASKRTTYVDGAALASINGLTVIFTGKRLTQVHADVWMGIMHLAREHYSGDKVTFRERQLLELIGRYTHQRQRAELKQWIRQLQATSVLIQDDAKQKRFGGSLLPSHEEDDGDGHTKFVVNITRELARVLSGNFSRIDWATRKALQGKPLALWLQTFFTRFPKPVAVQQLHALSGSTSSLKKFRQNLALALEELHAVGGYSAAIDREHDIVVAVKRPPPKPRRPLHEGQEELPFLRVVT